MKAHLASLRPVRAGATLLGGAALLFAVATLPASAAGTTLVSGVSVFNTSCQAPVGDVPGNTGDYPPIDFAGSLAGCWYTYVTYSRFNPSGTYVEQGNELFVGCLNGGTCGTFDTVYTFTGKYDASGMEIHGRCEHRIVGGTGDFANAQGVITFKDDVVNMTFDYRGQIMLATPGTTATATASASKGTSAGVTRVGGC